MYDSRYTLTFTFPYSNVVFCENETRFRSIPEMIMNIVDKWIHFNHLILLGVWCHVSPCSLGVMLLDLRLSQVMLRHTMLLGYVPVHDFPIWYIRVDVLTHFNWQTNVRWVDNTKRFKCINYNHTTYNMNTLDSTNGREGNITNTSQGCTDEYFSLIRCKGINDVV